MKNAVFWDMTVCSVIGLYSCVRGTYCPSLQNMTSRQHISSKLSLGNTELCACGQHTSTNNTVFIHDQQLMIGRYMNYICNMEGLSYIYCFVVPSNDQTAPLIWALWYRVSLLSYSSTLNINTESQHLPGHLMTAGMLRYTLSWTAYTDITAKWHDNWDFVLSCRALRLWDHF